MAYRSDTSNRDIDNTVIETVLEGEISFDYSIRIPELEYEKVEEHLEGLKTEITEDVSGFRDRVEILYLEEDQETVYNLLD